MIWIVCIVKCISCLQIKFILIIAQKNVSIQLWILNFLLCLHLLWFTHLIFSITLASFYCKHLTFIIFFKITAISTFFFWKFSFITKLLNCPSIYFLSSFLHCLINFFLFLNHFIFLNIFCNLV